jgi:excisionase family DNA binding protein
MRVVRLRFRFGIYQKSNRVHAVPMSELHKKQLTESINHILKQKKMIEQQIMITLPLQDFRTLIRECVRSELEAHKPPPLRDEPEYITAREAASILRVSLPTLRRYTKISIIACSRLGVSLRYRKEDVHRALQTIRTIKHSRRG